MTLHRRHLVHEDGQSVVLATFLLTALLGMAALVIDAGAWFRASRSVQAVADSAALAGAQAIPQNTTTGRSLALQYSTDNGGGVASSDVAFSATYRANDTISVTAHKTEQGFFSRLFGIDTVNMSTTAKVVAADLSQASGVAPFVVDHDHPLLKGAGCPCFNQATSITDTKVGPGAFGLVNLDDHRGGNSPGTLHDWILGESPGPLGLGWYHGDPGAKFNSSQVKSALDDRIGDTLLFPVQDGLQGQGANFEYHVIGFVGFHLTGYDVQGPAAQLFGYFTMVIWDGLPDTTGGTPDYGAHTVYLTQ